MPCAPCVGKKKAAVIIILFKSFKVVRMDILFLLIPMSLVLVFAIGALFWWALQRRQFDDLEQQGQRILDDKD